MTSSANSNVSSIAPLSSYICEIQGVIDLFEPPQTKNLAQEVINKIQALLLSDVCKPKTPPRLYLKKALKAAKIDKFKSRESFKTSMISLVEAQIAITIDCKKVYQVFFDLLDKENFQEAEAVWRFHQIPLDIIRFPDKNKQGVHNLLCKLSAEKNLQKVQWLLDHKADVNYSALSSYPNSVEHPPLLFVAVASGLSEDERVERIQLLLKNGANPMKRCPLSIPGSSIHGWSIAHSCEYDVSIQVFQMMMESLQDMSSAEDLPNKINVLQYLLLLKSVYTNAIAIGNMVKKAKLFIFHGLEADLKADREGVVLQKAKDLYTKKLTAARNYRSRNQQIVMSVAGDILLPELAPIVWEYIDVSARSFRINVSRLCIAADPELQADAKAKAAS